MTTSITENTTGSAEDLDAEVTEPATATSPVGEPNHRGRWRWFHRLSRLSPRASIIAFTVLAVLLAAATTTTVVFARSTAHHNAVAAGARAAQASAESRIPKVLSYDFNTIDTEFPVARDNLTGKFRDDFADLSSSVIIPAAHRDSIITKAKTVGASVVSADIGKVTLLLFLNQETSSAKYQGPRLDGSRVRVTTTNVGGQWLISDITPV